MLFHVWEDRMNTLSRYDMGAYRNIMVSDAQYSLGTW